MSFRRTKLQTETAELLASLSVRDGLEGLYQLAKRAEKQAKAESGATSGALVILRSFLLQFAKALDGNPDPALATKIDEHLRHLRGLVENPTEDSIKALASLA